MDNIISGTQIDCSKLGQPAEVPSKIFISFSSINFNDFVLEDPYMEHKTNDSKRSNSQHEGVKEDTTSSPHKEDTRSSPHKEDTTSSALKEDTTYLPGIEATDSRCTSSTAVSQPEREIIPDTSPKIPLSHDVESIQTQSLLQQGHLSAITTSSEQSVIVNEFSSKRNRREKGDDDFNPEQRNSLISAKNTVV